MGCREQMDIRGACLRYVPTIQRIIESLPKDVRTCSKCEEAVILQVTEHLPNQGGGIPFGKAAILGCDESLGKVIERIVSEGARLDLALGDCFERNA